MGNIYVITNKINGKQYVGKTYLSIEERFEQHKHDSKKSRNKNRPLYRAFNKYGVENFEIELKEATDNLEERERYWIQKLNTYKNGYNATLGGDGKSYIDHNQIIKAYKKFGNIKKVAEILGHDASWISNILKSNNMEIVSGARVTKESCSKMVKQYTLDGVFIATYSGIREAARIVLEDETKHSHINDCCKGKRKSAYHFIWKFAE